MKTMLSKMKIVVVALACVMLGVFFFVGDKGEVKAEDVELITDDKNVGYAYVQVEGTDVKKGKKPDMEFDGYLFAGWYTADGEAVKSSHSVDTAATYRAKFIPEEVLGVKAQLSNQGNLRFVSSVDGLSYSQVGFILERNGEKFSNDTRDVFKRIEAKTEGDEYTYSPKVVDTDSEYFVTAIWTNVQPNDTFYVRAYFKTLDGVEVVGPSRYLSPAHSNTSNINIAVKGLTGEAGTSSAVSATNLPEGITASATVLKAATTEDAYAHVLITLKDGTNKDLESLTIFDFGNGVKAQYRNLFTTIENGRDTSWYTEADANENEFVIATSADLYGFADVVNGGNVLAEKTVYMVADIEANKGYAYPGNNGDITTAGWKKDVAADGTTAITDGTDYEWPIIGRSDEKVYFAGTFDGQMHTISGLYRSGLSSGRLGLFGETQKDAVLKNFQLTNSYLKMIGAKNSYVGSVVGIARGGAVENIYSDAIVTNQYQFVGGLIGLVDNSEDHFAMSNCWFDGKVTNNSNFLGGLVGSFGTSSTKNITKYTQTITDCLNTGEIIVGASSKYVGGLFGYTYSNGVNISRSLSDGEIKCENTHANYVSFNLLGNYTSGYYPTINSTYATTQTTVTTDISTGTTTAEPKNFFQVDPTVIAGTSALTVELNNENNADPKILFTNVTKEETYANESYWAITNEAPVLSAFADVAGVQHQAVDTSWFRTDKTSFTLMDAADLYGLALLSRDAVAENFANEEIYLGADIVMNEGITYGEDGPEGEDATPIEWLPIGTPNNLFKGKFYGKGHNISGVYLNSTTENSNGLFGDTSGATLNDFSLTDSYFNSQHRRTGSIAGMARGGSFKGIYSSAIVSASDLYVGGLIGYVQDKGFTMDDCWFNGTVTGNSTNSIGGLVGYILSSATAVKMTNCLNSGTVNPTSSSAKYVGGLIGYCAPGKQMTLKNCLNTGTIVPAEDADTTKKQYGLISGYLQQSTPTVGGVYTIEQDSIAYAYSDADAGAYTVDDKYMVAIDTIQGENAVDVLSELFELTTTDGKAYWVTTDTAPVLKTFKNFADNGANK